MKKSPFLFVLGLACLYGCDLQAQRKVSIPRLDAAVSSTHSPKPIIIYLVHRVPVSAGNLMVELWDAEMFGLENFSNYQRMEVPPLKAHMLTGLMPREERGYRLRTSSISSPSILRLSLAGIPVIRDFRVSPGDSVMISVQEKTASLVFTGPSAPKFRLQKELAEVVAASVLDTDVGLPFRSEQDLQEYLNRPGNKEAWDSISTAFGRKTALNVAGQPELEYLRGMNFGDSERELRRRLDLYKGEVDDVDLQAILAGATGSLYWTYLKRLSAALRRAEKLGDTELTRRFRDFIQSRLQTLPQGLEETEALNSPAFRDYLIARAVLKSQITDSNFFETAFLTYSRKIAERLAVQYLSDSRRRLPDFEDQAITLNKRLKTSNMKAVLAEMIGRFGQGAPVFPFDLITLDGQRIKPEDFKGKALLVDFWITGCGACKSFHERIFDPLIGKYSEHPDLQIISVCADRKPVNWKFQRGTPNLIHNGFIPVYAERSHHSNPLLSYYNIHSYPQLMLVRPDGTLSYLGSVPTTLEDAEKLVGEMLKKKKATP